MSSFIYDQLDTNLRGRSSERRLSLPIGRPERRLVARLPERNAIWHLCTPKGSALWGSLGGTVRLPRATHKWLPVLSSLHPDNPVSMVPCNRGSARSRYSAHARTREPAMILLPVELKVSFIRPAEKCGSLVSIIPAEHAYPTGLSVLSDCVIHRQSLFSDSHRG
jgi:hypothetical protein